MKQETFERGALVLAVICLLGCVFLPLVVIAGYDVPELEEGTRKATVTFGIGVILRATMRRIFRSASRSLLRTTVSTVTRTSARTFTRRALRLTLRTLFGSFVRQAGDRNGDPDAGRGGSPATQNAWLAIGVSFGVLALSFYFVLRLIPVDWREAITTDHGYADWQASLLAAVPILVLGATSWGATRLLGNRVQFAIAGDAVLLQAYFTGAGSFLPMTTDIFFDGDKATRGKASAVSLGALFLLHLACFGIFAATGNYLFEFLSAMILIYTFVYSFPIAPMQGYDIWHSSKIGWCLFFAPIFLSFINLFPIEFAELV